MIKARLSQRLVNSTLDSLRTSIVNEIEQLKNSFHKQDATQPMQPLASNELHQLNNAYLQTNDVPIDVQAEPFDDFENVASEFLNEDELLNLLAEHA